jgi:hypothetical protein
LREHLGAWTRLREQVPRGFTLTRGFRGMFTRLTNDSEAEPLGEELGTLKGGRDS